MVEFYPVNISFLLFGCDLLPFLLENTYPRYFQVICDLFPVLCGPTSIEEHLERNMLYTIVNISFSNILCKSITRYRTEQIIPRCPWYTSG